MPYAENMFCKIKNRWRYFSPFLFFYNTLNKVFLKINVRCYIQFISSVYTQHKFNFDKFYILNITEQNIYKLLWARIYSIIFYHFHLQKLAVNFC